MWRLHWRRAIFYSAITKRQHVSPPCTYVYLCACMCACAHVRMYTCTYLYRAPLYAYLLTGALFVDNDETRR